jgi:hypothetical protein
MFIFHQSSAAAFGCIKLAFCGEKSRAALNAAKEDLSVVAAESRLHLAVCKSEHRPLTAAEPVAVVVVVQ